MRQLYISMPHRFSVCPARVRWGLCSGEVATFASGVRRPGAHTLGPLGPGDKRRVFFDLADVVADADVQGAIDQTRGILTHVNAVSPGAFHDDVAYTTVCGTCVTGAALNVEASLEEKICGQGYKQVCDSASVAGDGIVPRASAHLEGANQIDLDGVYHSPIGKGSRQWYGDVVDVWLEHVYTTAK